MSALSMLVVISAAVYPKTRGNLRILVFISPKKERKKK